MNMKPQKNEDLKVPDHYFDQVKLHWRNVLEVEDGARLNASQLKELPRKKIGLVFLFVFALGAGSYMISTQFKGSNANEKLVEKTSEIEQTDAIVTKADVEAEFNTENEITTADQGIHFQIEQVNTTASLSNEDKQFQIQDSSFHTELALLTPEEIEVYLLHENPEVLVETIY